MFVQVRDELSNSNHHHFVNNGVQRPWGQFQADFSEIEFVIPLVNNASHTASVVCSAQRGGLQTLLVCKWVGSERRALWVTFHVTLSI